MPIKFNNDLTQEELKSRLALNPKTGVFFRLHATGRHEIGPINNKPDKYGRIKIRVNGKTYAASRLAWLYYYGEWPKQEIDHRDRNPLNNSIKNLRQASASQNNMNSAMNSRNTSGHRGVHWVKKYQRWQARITAYGKSHHLGYYQSIESACKAYERAHPKFHGDFASDVIYREG